MNSSPPSPVVYRRAIVVGGVATVAAILLVYALHPALLFGPRAKGYWEVVLDDGWCVDAYSVGHPVPGTWYNLAGHLLWRGPVDRPGQYAWVELQGWIYGIGVGRFWVNGTQAGENGNRWSVGGGGGFLGSPCQDDGIPGNDRPHVSLHMPGEVNIEVLNTQWEGPRPPWV